MLFLALIAPIATESASLRGCFEETSSSEKRVLRVRCWTERNIVEVSLTRIEHDDPGDLALITPLRSKAQVQDSQTLYVAQIQPSETIDMMNRVLYLPKNWAGEKSSDSAHAAKWDEEEEISPIKQTWNYLEGLFEQFRAFIYL